MHRQEREREQDPVGENTEQGCSNTKHFQDGSNNTHLRDPLIRRTDHPHKKELPNLLETLFPFTSVPSCTNVKINGHSFF